MKKKNLTQKVLMGLMGTAFVGSSMFFAPVASAAVPDTPKVSVTVQTADGAQDFSERVQKILDQYHDQLAAEEAAREANLEAIRNQGQNQPAATNGDYEPRYNFEWQGTPLASSLYGIARIAHKDIVVNGKVDGSVYMSLHNVTYREALDRLASAFNLNWMEDGNSMLVSTSDLMKQSKTFKIHHIFNTDILKSELKGIGFEDDDIYPNAEQRTVSVAGTAYQIAQAEKRIHEIDKPVSQCLVVAQLIEVNHGKNSVLGFDYTLPSYTHTADDSGDGSELKGSWGSKLTFGVVTTANRALNNGKVIARPMIMMMNGQEGMVNFGDQVPIMTTTATTGATSVNTEYKDVGTKLTITPSIDDETGTVMMKVDTQVSNITGYETMGQTKAPNVSTRQATTSAHLKSGQSFVIGGLMTKNYIKNLNGIPGLMNLPILGELFSFHNKTHSYGEVYVMLTPYIVTDDINPQDLIGKTYSDKILTEQREDEAKAARKAAK